MTGQADPKRRRLGQGDAEAVQLGTGRSPGVVVRTPDHPEWVEVGLGSDLPAVMAVVGAGRYQPGPGHGVMVEGLAQGVSEAGLVEMLRHPELDLDASGLSGTVQGVDGLVDHGEGEGRGPGEAGARGGGGLVGHGVADPSAGSARSGSPREAVLGQS